MDSFGSRRLCFSKVVGLYMSLLTSAKSGTYVNHHDFFASETNDNRMSALFSKEDAVFQKEIAKTKFACEPLNKPAVNGDVVEIFENESWRSVIVSDHENRDMSTTVYFENGESSNWRHIESKNLTALKKQIRDNRGDQIPIFPSYPIFCSIVGVHVKGWHDPIMKLFDSYILIIEEIYMRAIEYLSTASSLKSNILSITIDAMSKIRDACRKDLEAALLQYMRPYTLNHYLFDILLKMRNEPIIKSLKGIAQGDSVSLKAVLAILKSHGIGNASNEDKEALDMEMAINAYLKVAKKRLTDEIPLLINQHLVTPFLAEISDKLNLSDERLSEILAESPHAVDKRRLLYQKQESLMKSKVLIVGL